MESKLEGAVNYLQFVGLTCDAAKQNKELHDRPPQQQEEAYLSLPIYIYTKMPTKDGRALILIPPLEVSGAIQW